MRRKYFVYILASDSRELYVGVTNSLEKRLAQHRSPQKADCYTANHLITHLVYCEETTDVRDAIRREKQIKGWTRRKKLELIDNLNPDWRDLGEGL